MTKTDCISQSCNKLAVLASAALLLVVLSPLGGADAAKHFHHCSLIGGSDNNPHLFDASEVYSCDEGNVEIAGQERLTIEHGYLYPSTLGRIGQPRIADANDYKSFKWCPTPKRTDTTQMERCRDQPVTCWDGKQATWDETWQGYSCMTADHMRKEMHQ